MSGIGVGPSSKELKLIYTAPQGKHPSVFLTELVELLLGAIEVLDNNVTNISILF